MSHDAHTPSPECWPAAEAVIFDLDGVLISSAELHWQAFRRTFAPEGVDFTFEHYLRVGVGVARENVIRGVLGEVDDAKLGFLMQEKERHVRDVLATDGLAAIPGSVEFVRRVRAAGLLTAVATASRTPLPFLDAIGARQLFGAVLDRMATSNPKPAPDIYLKAAATLGVDPPVCLVVEDSPPGVRAGRAAGMRVLAVTTTHRRDELREATAIYDAFDGIDLNHWLRG